MASTASHAPDLLPPVSAVSPTNLRRSSRRSYVADRGRPAPSSVGCNSILPTKSRALLRLLTRRSRMTAIRCRHASRPCGAASPVRAVGTPADSTAATVERVSLSVLLLERSRPKPWHLCGLLSIRGVPDSKARFDPCLVALRSDQKWMIKRAPPHGSVCRIETPPQSKGMPL